MRDAIDRFQLDRHGDYWEIAITTSSPTKEHIGGVPVESFRLVDTEPLLLLGFDVADRWLLSGLTNCVHRSEPDFAGLKHDYEPFLNRFHLFDDSEIANTFRHVSDGRVPDHAPFFVFSLWRVPPLGADTNAEQGPS